MKSQRIRAYDNLKFIAILGVILYHYFQNFLPGGYLGVDIFFVLSGYLIAYRSEKDLRKNSENNVLSEILKKLKGLILPLILFVVLSLLLLLVFRRDFLNNIQGQVISSLLFVNNWQQIFSGQSYFDTFINPSIYTHLWYLSVYFQVICIWYLAYPLVRKGFNGDLSKIRLSIFIVAFLSGLWMFILSLSLDDPTRVYYGTDTRIFAFLLGAFAGLKVYDGKIRKMSQGDLDKRIGVLYLIVFIFLFTLADDSFFTYKFGIFVFSLVVARLVYLLSAKNSIARIILSFKPTAAIGANTLPIYLWYYPIFILFYQSAQTDNLTNIDAILQIVLIFIIAFAFKKLYDLLTSREIIPQKAKILAPMLAFIGIILIASPRDKAAEALNEEKIQQEEIMKEQNEKNRAANESEEKPKLDNTKINELRNSIVGGTSPGLVSGLQDESEEEETDLKDLEREFKSYKRNLSEDELVNYEFLSDEEAFFAYRTPVTFFGDSLTLLSSSGLSVVFPKSTIFSEVSLHLEDAFPIAETAIANGKCADVVVVFLGSNGGFSQELMEEFLALFGDREVYIVTTHVNRNWRTEVNETLTNAAKTSDNFHLIDWSMYYNENADPDTWIKEEDDVHFSRLGVSHYINFIVENLYQE